MACVWQAAAWWEADLSGANSATVWEAMCQCEGLLCCGYCDCECVLEKMCLFLYSVCIYIRSDTLLVSVIVGGFL